MKKIIPISLSILSLSTSALVEVDVVAEKISKSKDDVTSSVSYFSESDIQNSNQMNLPDFLQARAGIQMGSTGGIGQTTSTYIRGAKSEYLLVIVDGIEVNDPSSIGAQFELQHLDLNSIESIEILKGPQTVLYGADALSGVINITTKAANKSRSSFYGSYGSYNTKKIGGSMSTRKDNLSFHLNASTLQSDSFSSSSVGNLLEKDSYAQTNVTGKITYHGEKSETTIVVKMINSDAEIDNNNADVRAKDSSTFKQWSNSIAHHYKFSDSLQSSLKISESSTKRVYELYSLEYFGRKQKVTVDSSYKINNSWKTMLGFDFERNKVTASGSYNNRHDNERSAFWLNFIKWKNVFSDQGVRITSGISEAEKVTTKFGVGYHFPMQITLKANYATAFKAPTLDELYSPFGGNSNLKPTKSESVDVILTKKMGPSSFELTYFNTNYRDQIVYSSKYENRDRSKSQGLETSLDYFFAGVFRVDGSYTYLRAIESGSGKYLARRARHFWNFGLEYLKFENYLFGLRTRYVGKRNETDNYVLKSYILSDFYTQAKINETLNLKISINNIFDEKYEQIKNYSTAGRNFLVTGEFSF
ncbi:TonB-dependent receptor plug domain protein [Bacteriovorax sp. BSW11_IV]|uniref:TonB-dependent receptor plug domain-containing protein n=1 Tax=Bacteriovorax sp. BSW11_IV TaxID=1353529 RepID=UPI00038A1F4B|nr:TonB-dependent receptor [Bacteriovorax sp. BSW11_IV]EQC48371.1 TonB-dependent receptor plug domain protein [Bacteriovorax sp. BSW11_IV]